MTPFGCSNVSVNKNTMNILRNQCQSDPQKRRCQIPLKHWYHFLFLYMVLFQKDNAMIEYNIVVSGKKQLIMSKKNSCKKVNNQNQGHQK